MLARLDRREAAPDPGLVRPGAHGKSEDSDARGRPGRRHETSARRADGEVVTGRRLTGVDLAVAGGRPRCPHTLEGRRRSLASRGEPGRAATVTPVVPGEPCWHSELGRRDRQTHGMTDGLERKVLQEQRLRHLALLLLHQRACRKAAAHLRARPRACTGRRPLADFSWSTTMWTSAPR